MDRTFAGARLAPSPSPRVSPVLDGWLQDWAVWSQTSRAAHAVRRWQSASMLMAPLTSVEEIIDGCGRDPAVQATVADRRLLFLVRSAVAGDVDAARVVVARMLPALLSKAAAHTRRGRLNFDEAFGELVAAAWIVVTTYPVARRPAKVWINVLLDTERAVFGRPRMAERMSVLLPPHLLAGHTTTDVGTDGLTDPLLELLELLAAARRAGLSPISLQLLLDMGVHGFTSQQLAARDGITDRAVRLRRRRAITELSGVLALTTSPPPTPPPGGHAHPARSTRRPALAGAV
ncbi:sigma-70 family RNA polymerase sigma factor [Frankia gtarii]|uniref:sigma-70 family RNA polymerase sigma factor n=1 Tax=Frankia gtarii TaxID=2950102 RepID=UPI0021BF54C8|nr:sigma-70 family RNA polymerase sigma factor [Frankia gtarii]